jgi:N-acetylmuramoyl-L-alanine amidase
MGISPWALALSVCLAAGPGATPAPPLPLVVIDPGHGGEQLGAVGVCGLREKDLTLAVSLELERLLIASGRARVVLTRRGDDLVELEDRVRVANAARADLLLSVHGNAAPGESAHGVETYFVSRKAADKRIEQLAIIENDGVLERPVKGTLAHILDSLRVQASAAESQRFAKLVQASVSQRLGSYNRGVMQAPFFVLRMVDMASVLVELGFLTHPADCERLQELEAQRRIAQGLAAAVLAHLSTSLEPMQSSVRP